MNLVYVIRKRDRKQPVSDYLLLEEALSHWNAMEYEHPAYYIEVFEGPEIPLPEQPIEAMYLFITDDDSLDEYPEPIENFHIIRFM
jgi:hypothetical protein